MGAEGVGQLLTCIKMSVVITSQHDMRREDCDSDIDSWIQRDHRQRKADIIQRAWGLGWGEGGNIKEKGDEDAEKEGDGRVYRPVVLALKQRTKVRRSVGWPVLRSSPKEIELTPALVRRARRVVPTCRACTASPSRPATLALDLRRTIPAARSPVEISRRRGRRRGW